MQMILTAGMGGSGSELLSATPLVHSLTQEKVRVVFDQLMKHTSASESDDALNPHNYIFTGGLNYGLEVDYVVHVSGNTTFDVFLKKFTEQGQNYTVKVINIKTTGGALPDPVHDTASFSGIITPVEPAAIHQARAVDARTLEIIFTEAVVVSDALVPSNYTISPTLAVQSVAYVSPTTYRLTTARQAVGQSYTVAIANIADIYI